MKTPLSIALLIALSPLPTLAAPAFMQVAVPEHIYAGGWEHFVGGGVAVFDCDGDGLPELYAAGGENPASLIRNNSTPNGALAFTQDTPAALALTGVTGAYPIDINSDGMMDLVVLRAGQNQLIKGGENCTFSELATLKFDGSDRWTTAFSATWEQGQTLPTLAFGNYVDRENPEGPFEACDDNQLLRPNGNNYAPSASLSPGFCALSILFSDWGRNGRQDLRVSNDRHYYVKGGEEQMWAMEDTPRLYGEADGWQSFSLWGMGIASRDITGDGLPEIFLSSMGDQKLQYLKHGANGPVYRDATYERGTTAHRPYTGDDGRPSTGWQISFGDVDNDGRDDVFIAKGNVEQMLGSAMHDPNNLLMQDNDGHFTEAGDIAGIASMEKGRGAALVDLNKDGLLDLVVINRRAPMEVYANQTEDSGNWLSIALAQSGANTNAVGAWVELNVDGKIVAREITIGGGHASGSMTSEHFGLGENEMAKLRVIWPDGTPSDWHDVNANMHLTVSRNDTNLAITAQ